MRRLRAVRLRALAALVVGAVLTVVLGFFAVQVLPSQYGTLLASLVAVAVVVRFIERGALRGDGLFPPGGLRQGLAGLALGAALSAGTVLLICATGVGALSWRGTGRLETPVLVLAAAAFEELVFRGLLLRLLARAAHPLVGVAVSAAFFGLAHATNQNATVVSSVAIAVEAGLLLAAAWFAGRSLWLPIGVHAGWNFMQGPVLGAATSGGAATRSLFAFAVEPGHELVTGGAFGPEASLVAVALCLLATVGLMARALRASRTAPSPDAG